MDYSQYTDNSAAVKEYMVEVSDGVSLKIIDFTPCNVSSEKPVILFVAGWISLIAGWKGVLKVLTEKYRIIYLETREKQSSIVANVKKVSFSMERLQLDIGEVIEKTIPPSEKFIIAGSSLGASAIIEYCASERRKPLSAILISPKAEFGFPKILELIVPAIHPSLAFLIIPVIKWYLRNYALLNRVNNINVRCLIISATTDILHGTDEIKQIMNIIPDSTYVEMESNMETHSEKAGHVILEYIQG
jgi:pimeloyl-ACP methyl ester carboxylesterase